MRRVRKREAVREKMCHISLYKSINVKYDNKSCDV
jgi:hypothetical protein